MMFPDLFFCLRCEARTVWRELVTREIGDAGATVPALRLTCEACRLVRELVFEPHSGGWR